MPEKIPINKLLSTVNQLAKNLYDYTGPTGTKVSYHRKPLTELVHAVRKARQTYVAQKRFAKTPQKRFQRNIKFITTFLVDSFNIDTHHPILVENSKVRAPQIGFGVFEHRPEIIAYNQLTTQDYTVLPDLQTHLKNFYRALEEYLQNNQSDKNNLTGMVEQWIKDEMGTRDEIAQRLAQINRPWQSPPQQLATDQQPLETTPTLNIATLDILLPLFSMFGIYCAHHFNTTPMTTIIKFLLIPSIGLGATAQILSPDLIPSCTRHIVSHLRNLQTFDTMTMEEMTRVENESRTNYRR